ncbi:MAG: metallophosphoesterase [Eubacteriales bacterium]|nr:metallophosphoesterase [Eubacteriales bacterium]
MNKTKKSRRLLIVFVAALIVAGAGVYIFIDNTTVCLTPYTVYSTKLPDEFAGYKIALISDFHNSYFYDQIISRLKQASPDLILLAGDMVHINHDNYDNTMALLSALPSIAPTYMVYGNHDAWYPDNKTLQREIEKTGVVWLVNRQLPIERGNSKIYLYGMNDPFVKDHEIASSKAVADMLETLKTARDPGTFSVLLMHRANLFAYMNDNLYDLVLAGHIHGGLVRLPFIGGLLSSELVWFPNYDKGIYTKKGSKMVVTVGCDYDLSRIRVFNGPEVVLVTLQK